MADETSRIQPVLPPPAPAPLELGAPEPPPRPPADAEARTTMPAAEAGPSVPVAEAGPSVPVAEPPPVVASGPARTMPGPTPGGPRKVQGQPVPEASVTPLVHYYRAEISRSIAWRNRMDATTNWAIISTTAIISVAYGDPRMPHILIPLGGVMVLLLMCIEARRYRFYDVWRSRTRLLEAHMIVPFLLPEHTILQGNWREALAEDLIMPTYKMSFWRAAASRLRRNYIWMFMILFAAWVLRIVLYQRPVDLADFYVKLAIGPIPSWIVLSVLGLFHIFLLAWMAAAGTGEDPDVLVYKRVRGKGASTWPL
jgi:uncharacterized membrane protein